MLPWFGTKLHNQIVQAGWGSLLSEKSHTFSELLRSPNFCHPEFWANCQILKVAILSQQVLAAGSIIGYYQKLNIATKSPGGANKLYYNKCRKVFVSFDISLVTDDFDNFNVSCFMLNVSDHFDNFDISFVKTFQISLTKNVGRTKEKNVLLETW